MGEALIVRRGSGAKIAEGFPKQIYGDTMTIPDLVGCNGFALFALGTGNIGGYISGHIVSIFYDGDKVSYCMVSTGDTTTRIYTDAYDNGAFDPATGTITFPYDRSLSSSCATQCVYW